MQNIKSNSGSEGYLGKYICISQTYNICTHWNDLWFLGVEGVLAIGGREVKKVLCLKLYNNTVMAHIVW